MDQIPFPAQSVQVTIGCFPRHPNHNVNSGLARTSLMTGNQCTYMIRIVVESTGEGNMGFSVNWPHHLPTTVPGMMKIQQPHA